MIKDGIGGAHTKTGLHFEAKTSFEDALLKIPGYRIEDKTYVFFNDKKVAEIYQKHELYKKLLEPNGIDYKKVISKKLLPDNAIFVIINNTLFIVEIKYQETPGSVDEKLQTCEFKLLQYRRLVKPLGYNVEFCYILSEWFKKKEYNDVLNFIQSKGCKYFFDELPLDYLGMTII